MAAGFQDCKTANLQFAMGLVFLIYSTVFIMMLLQFIGLVSCLKTIPRAIMGFYFILVSVMFYVQMILFKGDDCSLEAPVFFFWLVAQIALFYLIVAFGLAKWGSYICWQAENYDQRAKRAVDILLKKQIKRNQMMLENDDKKKPLLNMKSDEESSEEDEESESDEEQNNKNKKLPKQLAIGN